VTAIARAPLVGRVVDAWLDDAGRLAQRWALPAAAALPLLLVPAWVVADALQPPAYSPLRQTISVLAGHAATDRWVVTLALLLMGGCYLVAAAGLPDLGTIARAGLVVSAFAGIGVALCPEPARGSTDQHMAFTVIGAIALALWPATVPHGGAHPVLGRRLTLGVTAVFLGLLGWTFVEAQLGPVLGLAERVTCSVEVCWPVFVAVALRRSRRPTEGTRDWCACVTPVDG
jgi:hypothetical membrane protein